MDSGRKLYKGYYDNIGSRYYNALVKWCFLPFGGEEKVRREIIDAVDLGLGKRILDMCCGTGNATFIIAEKAGDGARITAADLSSGQIKVAKKRNRFPNINFIIADASETCFYQGVFDRVVIPHAIHEMPRAARLAVLEEARRILADGGALAVIEMDNPPNALLRLFIGFWWFYWLPFNFETPTRKDMLRHGVAEELREAGFCSVSKSSLFNGVFQVVQGKK